MDVMVVREIDTVRRQIGRAVFGMVAGPDGPSNRAQIHETPGPRWFGEDRPIRRVHFGFGLFIYLCGLLPIPQCRFGSGLFMYLYGLRPIVVLLCGGVFCCFFVCVCVVSLVLLNSCCFCMVLFPKLMFLGLLFCSPVT